MATNMLMPRIPLKSQEEELAAREQDQDEEFNIGPLSMLTYSMRNKTEVLISCRNNKKLLGKIKAFDCHCNLIMEDVREMWTETLKEKSKAGASSNKKKTKRIAHDRFIPKLFVRGDSVVMVLKNPFGTQPEAAQQKQKPK